MTRQKHMMWLGHYIFWALSGLWSMVAIYGFFTFGWIGKMADLSPAELVVQLSALFFPVGVFYLLGSYIDRHQLANVELSASRAYLEELVYPSDLGAQHVQDLNNELKQQIQTFRSSFADVTQQTSQVREDLNNWVADLNKIITHMETQTQKMAGFVQLLGEANKAATAQSADAGQNLAAQADILKKVTQETKQQLFETTKNLLNQTEEISQNVHAVVQAENSIGEALDKSASWVHKLGENTRQIEKAMKSTAVMQGFLNDSDKVLLRFKEIGATLDMRLNALKQEPNMPKAVPTEPVSGPTAKDFTKCMQQILDSLQGLSVEMMALFSIKNEEPLWAQYYAGDKAVFMRHILQGISSTKKQKIINMAKENKVFKENVKVYMKTFEDLTRGLENSPWLGVLVGSDPGRLYMVLASLFKGEKNASKVS